MRAGVLIIGSLLWDAGERAAWRDSRLLVRDGVHVKAPIRYGRRSRNRGDTFTMVFSAGGEADGQAMLVPCAARVEQVRGLIEEAQSLWKAEHASAKPGKIAARWGSVAILFRDKRAHADIVAAWRDYFRSMGSPNVPVNEDGILRITWPLAQENREVAVDATLATATRAEMSTPNAAEIADAWLAQSGGHERYFFENVRHGIRTADDSSIWQRIERRRPAWLANDEYAEAVEILRGEATREL